jgi:predicted glycosyltransferase
MKDKVDIVLLPRGNAQGVHYQDQKFSGIRVVTTALDIADIAPDCDLFIGAGGTMTREMAVLGIPTISVYQDELLDVDRYLLGIGAFLHRPTLTAAQALDFLATSSQQPPNRYLLDKGRAAYALVKRQILQY